jgi:hypothetical protein
LWQVRSRIRQEISTGMAIAGIYVEQLSLKPNDTKQGNEILRDSVKKRGAI